ncbi:metallophosphoesterase [Hydrogenovibrio kuenenii]|uniref:metallophosphoesterase n=1 Tax=Hydrogenovibrio kuenenii TaxID=63658 RepID=UPI0004663BAA|nr:metallophosphoesterase [Hydrogenovibrio kuenenii]
MFVRKFTDNQKGRDFLVGDIHGRYQPLMDALSHAGFDFDRDRLFAVGDLVDRGDESLKTLTLIDEPWFFSVRGNHEQFILDIYAEERVMLSGGYKEYGAEETYLQITLFESSWFFDLSDAQRQAVAEKLKHLPFAIELNVKGKKLGIVHAGMPPDIDSWKVFVGALEDRDIRERALRHRRHAADTANGKERPLVDIDYTIHGHSCFPKPVFGKYSGFIDTFDRSGQLTLMSIDELLVRIAENE